MEPLYPIAAEYLAVGSVTLGGIYAKYKLPVLLINKGTRLTPGLMIKLKRYLRNNRNIYVEKDYYDALVGNGLPQSLRQEFLEKSIGYDELKSGADLLITQLSSKQGVPSQATTVATDDIYEKIKTIDTALLLQCVNGDNDVDEYLVSHSTNVAVLNGMIGRWLGLNDKDLQLLIKSGLLHDVGKSEVPPEILHAPRRLTPEEFEQIKLHPVHSYNLILKNPDIERIVAITARSHHEKMTGNGYPDGLKGDEIPFFSRITAIADTYDAMVSSRCYKEAMSPFYVFEQLSIGSFSELDYQLIDLFLEKMSTELLGKSVLLSNGAIGKVKYINPRKWNYPIIQVDADVMTTSDDLFCLSVIL